MNTLEQIIMDVYEVVKKPCFRVRRASLVIPDFMWLGDRFDAKNKDFLTNAGITHVLNCADKSVRGVMTYKLAYCQLDAEDDENCIIIESCLVKAMIFLRQVARTESGKVLVHCSAGMNRSATIAVAYLMLEHHMHLVDAAKMAFTVRPWILTNTAFVRQLAYLQLEGKDYFARRIKLLEEEIKSKQEKIEAKEETEVAKPVAFDDLNDIV